MKKWLYVLSVSAMTAVFLFFYFAQVKETEAKERVQKASAERVAQEEAAKKKANEEKAQKDAADRAQKRADDEAKADAEKQAKYAAEGAKIKAEMDKALAAGDRLSKQFAALEIELDTLHKQREQTAREAFDAQKNVEQAKVARRNAELEIQRMTQMIANRAASSSLTRPATVATTK